MSKDRSLDYDGLDGILQPAGVVEPKSAWYQSGWSLAFVSAVLVGLFLFREKTPMPAISLEHTLPTAAVPSNQAPPITAAPVLNHTTVPAAETLTEAAANPPASASPAPIETGAAESAPVTETAAATAADITPPPAPSGNLFSVYFKFASKKPNPLTPNELGNLVSAANRCPNLIKLTGHTCSLGSDAGNQELGLTRAKALKKLLLANGIPAQRIVIASEGMRKPAAANDSQAGQALNRRAELSCLDQ